MTWEKQYGVQQAAVTRQTLIFCMALNKEASEGVGLREYFGGTTRMAPA